MRARLPFVLAALCGAACIAAQAGETAAPLAGPALIARLKARDLTLANAAALCDELVLQPTRVRLQAAFVLRSAYAERHKGFAKDLERLAERARRSSHELQRQRLGARERTEIVDLQKRAAAISRRADLTKETIENELDPLAERLRELLLVRPEQLRADERFAAQVAQLQGQRDELAGWHRLYQDSTAGFELDEDAERQLRKFAPLPAPLTAQAIDARLPEWALAGTDMAERDRRTLEANAERRAELDEEEYAGVFALNELRYVLGLALLRIDVKLCAAGRDHSLDMHTLGFFAHESPVAGKRSPGDRAARFGTSGDAENIAFGHDTGRSAIRGWWYSPGHHRNMLGDHGRVGLGRHETLWTQMFGG